MCNVFVEPQTFDGEYNNKKISKEMHGCANQRWENRLKNHCCPTFLQYHVGQCRGLFFSVMMEHLPRHTYTVFA